MNIIAITNLPSEGELALRILPGLIAAIWVYYDTGRRQSKHRIAWTVGALITNGLGAILWYFVRDDGKETLPDVR